MSPLSKLRWPSILIYNVKTLHNCHPSIFKELSANIEQKSEEATLRHIKQIWIIFDKRELICIIKKILTWKSPHRVEYVTFYRIPRIVCLLFWSTSPIRTKPTGSNIPIPSCFHVAEITSSARSHECSFTVGLFKDPPWIPEAPGTPISIGRL